MKGWLAITLWVIGYDIWAAVTKHKTLSSAYRQVAGQHPIPSTVFSCYMVAHLHGFIPQKWDPLRHLDAWARRDSNAQPAA